MEEKRRSRERAREMALDEAPRGAGSTRTTGNTRGIAARLGADHRNDQVAMHVASLACDDHSTGAVWLARARTEAVHRDKASAFELLNNGEGAVPIVVDGEVPIKGVLRPIVSTRSRVRRAARKWPVVLCGRARRSE